MIDLKKHWKENTKEDVMSYVYWQQGQMPPSDTEIYEKEWIKIQAQLTKRDKNDN